MAGFLLIAEFAYNNSKNASTGQTPFELNCGYYFCVSFKDKYDVRSKASSAKGLAIKLRELINIVTKTFYMSRTYRSKLMIKE